MLILNEITLFGRLILPPLIISFLGNHLHLKFQRRKSIHGKFIELVGNKTKQNKKSKEKFINSSGQGTRGIQAGSDQILYIKCCINLKKVRMKKISIEFGENST